MRNLKLAHILVLNDPLDEPKIFPLKRVLKNPYYQRVKALEQKLRKLIKRTRRENFIVVKQVVNKDHSLSLISLAFLVITDFPNEEPNGRQSK